MSTDPSGAAIGRVDAAVDESSPQAAASPRGLADLAAAIERVEALIAADATTEPKGSEALERIADIAFVLHERDVEASLCDALDAAVRELSSADALKQASLQRTHQAVELLREVSHRVNDMIALAAAPPPAAANTAARGECESATGGEQVGKNAADDEIPRDDLFATNAREDDEFAQAVAALAGSLPSLADPAESIGDPQREPADNSARSPDHAQALEPLAQGAEYTGVPEREAELSESESAAEVTLVIESASAVFLGEFLGEPSSPPAVATERSSIDQSSGHESSIGDIAGKLASSDASPPAVPSSFAGEGREDAISSAAVSNEIPSSELPPDAILPNTPAENVPLPAPEARLNNETGLALDAATLAGADNAAPDRLAPSEPADPAPQDNPSPDRLAPSEPADAAPQDSPAPADLVIEQPADHDLADRDVEREQPTHLAREADRQGAVDAADQAAANADDVGRPLGAEPSQMQLPGWQTPVGPDEDPGELFEPMADVPLAAPIEPALPLVTPAPTPLPPQSDLAAHHEQPGAPTEESAAEIPRSAQSVTNAPEAESLSGAAVLAAAALAFAPAAGQDVNRNAPPPPLPPPRTAAGAPPQASPRLPANDPLAPVRALSEEELIALFS